MRELLCAVLTAFGVLALAACASRPSSVSSADAVMQLRSGLPLLACREACVDAWRAAQPQAAQLAAAARWPELAALVVNIGYQDDLSLYYLGRAAEGLGYPGAAASYYRQSTYISGTSAACQYLSHQCGGVALPYAARLQVAAIERQLSGPRYRRAEPAAPPAAAPPSAAAPAAGGTGRPSVPEAIPPVTLAVPAPPEAPPETIAPPQPQPQPLPLPLPLPPPPPPFRPGTSDYIEPPAAPH